ncbi:hypothetical protein DFJ58DRAFT_846798 [Suillus subalutaceus]|uniref:uncharacterized protein n=1 Tax=Suillus subalutaceus TaxID=48586 RepID=UPI001B86EEEA|nr:uncharacterized protein DFJ58DRAFT_846798 [Suillus subalutaceus]KAG1836762.1 hypothetical protein DFJ58DRAFT_846798 [Suillus subalutaceus]
MAPCSAFFFVTLCWFTLGKSNLEELWQDVIAKNRWEKRNFNGAVVGVAIAWLIEWTLVLLARAPSGPICRFCGLGWDYFGFAFSCLCGSWRPGINMYDQLVGNFMEL